jgi:hypothetical protein
LLTDDPQANVPVGETIVPLIFLSDSTHLTNFAGDKKAWPVYMTIGNIHSTVRMKPTMHSVVLVALLPQPLKARDVPLSHKNKQKKHNRLIQQTVLDYLLQPLSNAQDWQFDAFCSDENWRRCHAVLSGWIGDYPEHVFLQGCGYGNCPHCEVSKDDLGQLPETPPPLRDHRAYETLYRVAATVPGVGDESDGIEWEDFVDNAPLPEAEPNYHEQSLDLEPVETEKRPRRTARRPAAAPAGIANNQATSSNARATSTVDPAIKEKAQEACDELEARGMKCWSNVLWRTGVVVSELPKPDLLHTMQLGMLKHLLAWLNQLLKKHKRLERFNDLWLSIPAYPDFTKPTKAYEEVSQWTGKELKNMSRFLVSVLSNALRCPEYHERADFNDAIECTRALLDFYMYCRYPSHDDDTLNLMDDALSRFHTHKPVFLKYRASKRTTAESRALRKELIEERDHELANHQSESASARDRRAKRWNDYIHSEVAQLLEGGSDFNLPKLHLLTHFRKSIERFGSLPQWSTETGETAHKAQIKSGYRASNRTGNFYLQILNYYLRVDAFAVRHMNNQALWIAKRDDRRSAPDDADCEINADDTPRAKRRCVESSPHLRRHLGSIQKHVKTFEHIPPTIEDPKLRQAFTDAMDRFVNNWHPDTTGEFDLQSCSAALYHMTHVPVEEFQNPEKIYQKIRATGSKTWYHTKGRNDWVWVKSAKQPPGLDRPYKALQGRLPARVHRLFKIDLAGEWLQLAFVERTRPANGGIPEKGSGMVRVVRPTQADDQYRIIDAGNIDGAAHLIPEIPDTWKERNTGWLVNSHIDLATWNTIYWVSQQELDRAVEGPRRRRARRR